MSHRSPSNPPSFLVDAIAEETVALLRQPALPRDSDEEPDIRRERQRMAQRPWWRRPSPYWYLCMMPLSAIAMGATIGPKVEVLMELACENLRPAQDPGNNLGDWDRLGSDLERHSRQYDRNVWKPDLGSRQIEQDGGMDSGIIAILIESPHIEALAGTPERCRSDPAVHKEVAKLTTVMTTITGLLGCLTVSFWGSMSDIYGRTRLVSINIAGLLFNDFNLIFVYYFWEKLPGGYWFLVVGSILDGLLGGVDAATAAIHAYLSDTVEPTERARIFSLNLGILFTGMAVGPIIGAIVVRYTNNPLSVFYFATTLHIIYACINWTILPESLTHMQMRSAHQKHLVSMAHNDPGSGVAGSTRRLGHRLLAFIAPLALFLPHRSESREGLGKARGRNWNLTFLGIAYLLATSTFGAYSWKFQYTASQYGWTSEQFGYWLSSVGTVRAIYLMVALPVILTIFKPKPSPIQLPTEPSAGSNSGHLGAPSTSSPELTPPQTPEVVAATPSLAFDLKLARLSLLIDVASYVFMPLAPTGFLFSAAGALHSFGTGFTPAMRSAALELYTRRGGTESGRLFGAMSVLHALGSSVFGPIVYGTVYATTFKWFPQAVFFVTAGVVATGLLSLSLVSLHRRRAQDTEAEE